MQKEKVSYSFVLVEITRRCNLSCAHCINGSRQMLDLSEEIIDNFLDRTEMIRELRFTGGEPTLALDRMNYLLDGIIKRNIQIHSFGLTTNGTMIDDNLADFIKRLHDYLYLCLQHEYKKQLDPLCANVLIEVSISEDDYHGTNKEELLKNAKEKIGDYAFVALINNGRLTHAVGRAKNLPEAMPYKRSYRSKILASGRDEECFCTSMTQRLIDKRPRNYIVCPLTLTAKGRLIRSENMSFDEEDLPENTIIDFSESAVDIWGSIEKYNKGKPYCRDIMGAENQSIQLEDLRTLKTYVDYKKTNQKEENSMFMFVEASKYISQKGGSVRDNMDFLVEEYATNDDRKPTDVRANIMFKDLDLRLIKAAYPHLIKSEVQAFNSLPSIEQKKLIYKNAYLEIKEKLSELYKVQDQEKKLKNSTKRAIDNKECSINEAFELWNGVFETGELEGFEDFLSKPKLSNNNVKYIYLADEIRKCIEDLTLDKVIYSPDDYLSEHTIKSQIAFRIAVCNEFKRCFALFAGMADSAALNTILNAAMTLEQVYTELICCDVNIRALVNQLCVKLKREKMYPEKEADMMEKIRFSRVMKSISAINGVIGKEDK